MYNQRALGSRDRNVRLSISETPIYVKLGSEITGVKLGIPKYEETPPQGSILVDTLNDLSVWKDRREAHPFLENGNPRYPRRAGNFSYAVVEDPARGSVMQVRPLEASGHSLVPMYGVLERQPALPIPGQVRKLGLWLKGNSSWGRVTFELVDANDERWLGVGGLEDDCGESFITFDGWHWVEVDLGGHYAREYPRPGHRNWRSQGGDGFIDYPLTLTKLILELRDRVVYVTNLVPVRNETVCLSELMAVY
jgi:hypothetical protein